MGIADKAVELSNAVLDGYNAFKNFGKSDFLDYASTALDAFTVVASVASAFEKASLPLQVAAFEAYNNRGQTTISPFH